MERDNFKKSNEKLTTNHIDYMESYKNNVYVCMNQKGHTIRSLAEVAGVPLSTLNSFLYGKPADAKLSTTIKLARALGVTVDELVGCETINPEERMALAQSRELPDKNRYLIKWFINSQYEKARKNTNINKIDVMIPTVGNGNRMCLSEVFEEVDVSNICDVVLANVFMGVRIIIEKYMPFYTPYDTILIANDRKAKPYEHCLYSRNGVFYIARRVFEGEKTKLLDIRDGKFRCYEEEMDELLGYIVCVYHNEHMWKK